MAIIDNFQEVVGLRRGQRRQSPVIEDQEVDARQIFEEPSMPPVAASESERIKQPWDAMIEHRAIVAARLVAQTAPCQGRAELSC